MGLEVTGTSDLIRDLAAMASALGEDSAATKRVLQAGAEPIHRRMVQNASVDPKVITGRLRGSIRIRAIRKKGPNRSISIGVHGADGPPYYNFVEFGHGGPSPAPAHPFIRPAYDAEANTAYETMKNELRAEIDRHT